jgi:hypothetical protein
MDRVPSIDPHSAGAKNLTQESTLRQVSLFYSSKMIYLQMINSAMTYF